MQTTKIKPLFNLVIINKEFIRTTTVASAAVKSDNNLKSWKEIPGPSSLPIIGQMRHFMPGGQLYGIDGSEVTMKLYELYGPIVKLSGMFGSPPMIILTDPECSELILRSENSLPIRPGFMSLEYYRKVYKKNKGHPAHMTGLVTDHGEVWKEFRSTVNPVMLQPKTIKMYATVLDEVAQDMIKRMKANRDEKNMITKDFDKEMNLWALESIGTVALGCRLNCFDPNLPADSPEWQLIQCVHDLFTTANEIDFKPNLWRYFSMPLFKKAMNMYEHHEKTTTVASAAVKSDNNLKSWKEIPGPSSLPIIGQMRHFMPGGQLYGIDGSEVTMKLYELYGPIVKLSGMFGSPPMIILTDPECSELILRSENSLPIRPGFMSLEYYRKVYKKNKGHPAHMTGLVTDHGEVWKEFRSTVNPVMLQPKTIKMYATVLDEVAQDMIKRMKANRDEKNMITKDFDKEMNLWALESIGTVALGCRLNCFDPNLPADSPEWQLIQCVHDLFTTANEIDFKPNLWRYFSMPLFKKAMNMYEHHENLTKHFIEKGKEQLKKKSDQEQGVLGKLLEINEDMAHIMASDMLFAGVDTAANTVTATLYLLAKNPEKQAKLREEIMSKCERRPYLRACIKESLRVMPIVSGNFRRTTKEYNILGYKIPKDMQVVFAHRDMSLLDENFPKPREYIPERWIASKDDPLYYGNANPFAHQPFGFGVRSCIGRRIAELEMDTFVARLIENFEVEWFGAPPTIQQASLNYIKGPFNFVFKDVK